MKRYLLLVTVAILSIVSATAQILGSGTLADPYHGITTTDFTISGIKYFNANIGASSGTLTISAGARVISVSTTACISITGSGRLVANGTSANTILFTADNDKDGIYGETTEYWGDIFITSSGISSLNYCTIERGQRLGSKIAIFGGGIYIGGSGSVTVNHSTIRFCTAYKGGGICIASGSTPTITNTVFRGNTANDHGGAIYVSATSAPVISNCIFRNNGSTSATLPGGAIASISGAPKIINSDITYSTASSSTGTSVYLENSTNALVVNTIIWGGTNHIALSGTPTSVFNSCAIEGESYSGCINLSSNNTDPTGPNFVQPGTSNYNLTFASPCRDTGADSYPGITIPSTDYAGFGRIGTKDIGAYEMVYSRWNGSTGSDWNEFENWDSNIIPTSSRNIIIPSGLSSYPTLSPGPSFTLNSGMRMIIQPGAKVSFTSLTNNGTIYVQSDASGIASLMTDSFSGSSGSLNVSLFITGGDAGSGLYRWHYIAPPASSPTSVFTSINPYNLLNYDESKVITNTSEGWQWHDGYDGTTGFTTLNPKEGYRVFNGTDATIQFSGLTSLTTTMGQINLPYSDRTTDTSLYGYSLIGNSLTCGLNWDLVTRSSTTYIRNSIFFETNGIVASYVNGVGTNGGTAHIPPLQGFFVKTRATGTYLTIPNSAREHNSTTRFKSENNSIPLIRLELSSATAKDESVIRLDESGTLSFDNEFDAGKMSGPVSNYPQIYSVMGGETYSINTIPWPDSQTTIPFTLKIPSEGSYQIKCTELNALGSSRATLTDSQTGSTIDLSTTPVYSFNSTSGTITGRFSVTVYSGSSRVTDIASDNSIRIFSEMQKIYIQPLGDEWDNVQGAVRIVDLAGHVIYNGQQEWFNIGDNKEYDLPAANTIVFVEITTRHKRIVEKIVVSR